MTLWPTRTGDKRKGQVSFPYPRGLKPVREEGGAHKATLLSTSLLMAELLPLLSWVPPGSQGSAQDSPVPPAEHRAQNERSQGLAPESWRFLEVPTIHITPSSDGESPPSTPTTPRLQRPRTPDLESLSQDR
ncbi:Hypothetical predicted protein [Marmota monax]|uniref:GRAM domain-containing protein 1A n=1 Tax=Marmota monax TaxID=9995 RepID=A0A5E4AGG3_MARMO|nr:GRAM domain-containing protein 1A [Marmota monax]VTJ55869.1 Hypothetical predicted protein [Marmota monax]